MSNTENHPSKARVLLVDDDEFAHEVLSAMLNQLGVTDISTATDGRVALRVLGQMNPPPDVILCDVFMPDMDGIEFLDALASRGFKGGVVVLSGVDANMLQLSRVIASSGGLRVLGSFTKPVTLVQLSSALGLEILG